MDYEESTKCYQHVRSFAPMNPYVDINDIAEVIGLKTEFLTGDITCCKRLQIKLADGNVLLLQTGDSTGNYWVALLKTPIDEKKLMDANDEFIYE